VIRSNRWGFWQEFQHFKMDSDKWFNLSEKAQKSHINMVVNNILGKFSAIQYVAETVHVDSSEMYNSCL